jgi:hypothetical protein
LRGKVTDLLIGDLFARLGRSGVAADGVLVSAGQTTHSTLERGREY